MSHFRLVRLPALCFLIHLEDLAVKYFILTPGYLNVYVKNNLVICFSLSGYYEC